MHNKMKKSLYALGITLMLSPVFPTIGKAEETTIDISDWALDTLIKGDHYGIYPLDWYEEDFLKPISSERLSLLMGLTQAKIAALDLPLNESFEPVSTNSSNLRGDIVNRFYNLIGSYDVNVGADPITYMQERQILRGMPNGLMLEARATTEQAVILATRLIDEMYHQAEAHSKGVAWVVEDEDTKLYLLGSIHLGIPDMYPINDQLWTAFNESDALFVEVDNFDLRHDDIYYDIAYYPEGQSIRDHISPETYAKIEEVAALINIPIAELASYKPWELANFISTFSLNFLDYGVSASEMVFMGVDSYFLNHAYHQEKPIRELENMEELLVAEDNLSMEIQEELLQYALDEILYLANFPDDYIDPLTEYFEYWRLGNTESFASSYMSTLADDEYTHMLFGQRNFDMANKLIELLETESGEFFVVVGAGHFLVENNIRDHLEAQNYEVKPFYE